MKEALGIDPRLLAIDPAGCGCTECLVGEYLPMENMQPKHVFAMALGLIANHTDWPDPTPMLSVEFACRDYRLSEV